jgi:hypothetical protein
MASSGQRLLKGAFRATVLRSAKAGKVASQHSAKGKASGVVGTVK